MKNVINKILIGSILTCSIFGSTSAYAYSTNDSMAVNSKISIPDKPQYVGSHDESFDVVPRGSYYYTVGSGVKSGTGYISFTERAENFKIIFKNKSTGKVVFTQTFFMAGPVDESGRPQGVKSVSFNMQMDGSSSYVIEVRNVDNVIISGDLHLLY